MTKFKYTVDVVIPVEIMARAQVHIVTTEKSLKQAELAKLASTQMRLWATGTCVDDVVTLNDTVKHFDSYCEDIEGAFGIQPQRKRMDLAIKIMKEDLSNTSVFKGQELT